MEVMEFGQQQRHMAHTTTNEAHSPATSPPRISRRFTGSPTGVVPHAPSNQTAFTVGCIATNSNILAQRDFPVGFTISTLFSYGGHTSSGYIDCNSVLFSSIEVAYEYTKYET